MQRMSIALAILALTACAGGKGERPAESAEGPSREAQQEARNLELDGWAEEFADVKLEIVSPKEGEVLPPGDVAVQLDLQNYEVWKDGAHVHLFLDGHPYIPIYDVSKPVMLDDVAPGAHVLRAFPSRPWHESIKSSPDAFAIVRFVVGEDDGKWAYDPEKPILTQSRPKGTYAGEQGKRILFDYYLTNAELSENGYRVRWTLDGEEHFATDWQPLWWENLAPGDHELSMELVDQDGAPVENGGLNRTTRTFTVKE
jgi:hypothetical protein